MARALPDGLYPFINERLPLSELVMVEAPSNLEALFKSQAAANGIDIEDRRRAEESLRQAQADLAHVNRVTTMGELTATLAHEVNQPIAAASINACAAASGESNFCCANEGMANAKLTAR